MAVCILWEARLGPIDSMNPIPSRRGRRSYRIRDALRAFIGELGLAGRIDLCSSRADDTRRRGVLP